LGSYRDCTTFNLRRIEITVLSELGGQEGLMMCRRGGQAVR